MASFCCSFLSNYKRFSIVVGQNSSVHRMKRTTGSNLITLDLSMQFFYYMSVELVFLNFVVILKFSLRGFSHFWDMNMYDKVCYFGLMTLSVITSVGCSFWLQNLKDHRPGRGGMWYFLFLFTMNRNYAQEEYFIALEFVIVMMIKTVRQITAWEINQ